MRACSCRRSSVIRYSSMGLTTNPVSVVSVGRTASSQVKIFPGQDLAPFFTQNLPDGTLMAFSTWFGQNWNLSKVDLQDNVTRIYQFPAGEIPAFSAFYGRDGNYLWRFGPA
jgi:hypothetical protein